MKHLSLALAALTLAPPALAQTVPARAIDMGTSYTLQSGVLGDAREVSVWLPTGYDKSKDRYPVVYVLDGALDQDFRHIAGLGYLASLSWTYGPMIVVGVQTKDRGAELTPPATDPRYVAAFPGAGGAAQFREFLGKEVAPFVEARFRTEGRRALMGESLAGLFVIDTLLKQPALFSDYIAISPSLWWDDRRAFHTLSAPAGLQGKRLYLAVANEGGTMQDGIDSLRTFLTALPAGRVTVRYADFSRTATHATVYHHAAEEALRWLYPAPPYDGDTPWFMIEGASPPKPAPNNSK